MSRGAAVSRLRAGAAVARARPPLEAIGRRAFEFGEDPGAAHVAKLASNFLIASAIEALAEAFTFSTKNGLDASRWHAMLSETIFACPIYKNYGQLILDGDYRRPLFQLALGLKDLGLVSQVAFESRTPMPLASLLRDRFLAAFAHGRGTLGLDVHRRGSRSPGRAGTGIANGLSIVRETSGVSFQLAMPLSTASWKLTPRKNRTVISRTVLSIVRGPAIIFVHDGSDRAAAR